ATLKRELREPDAERIFHVADAFRAGLGDAEVFALTRIDPWFLAQIGDLVRCEREVREQGLAAIDAPRMRALKRKGFSDARLAELLDTDENAVRHLRRAFGVRPVYKRVD